MTLNIVTYVDCELKESAFYLNLSLTSMVENGGREKNLAIHNSKFRPKQLKKDQM